MKSARGWIALAVACALHVGIAGLLRLTPSPTRETVQSPSVVDITLLEAIDEHVDSTSRDEPPRGVANAPASRTTDGARPRAIQPATLEAARAEEASPTLAGLIETPTPGGWSFRPTVTDLNLDPRSRKALDERLGAPVPTADLPPPASATGGLAEGLAARDREIGLGRGGPARSAVATVVQAANVMGVATLLIRIDTAGRVSVNVANASSDAAGWSNLSEAIRAELSAHRDRVRLAPNSRGLQVTVRAEAVDRLPDGRTTPRGTSVQATPGSVKETKERITIELPSATVAHEGKVCAASLTVGLAGLQANGGCSLENIGSTPVRMVSTRIVDESSM